MTENESIVIATNRFMELIVEGEGCNAQMETFIRVHTDKTQEQDRYEFLFFARDWFATRGFRTEVRPMNRVKGVKRLLIKFSLFLLRRSGR